MCIAARFGSVPLSRGFGFGDRATSVRFDISGQKIVACGGGSCGPRLHRASEWDPIYAETEKIGSGSLLLPPLRLIARKASPTGGVQNVQRRGQTTGTTGSAYQ